MIAIPATASPIRMPLYRQRAIIEEAKAVALAAVGEELGEANESKVKYAINAATVADADRKIVVGEDGVITIPAVSSPRPNQLRVRAPPGL